MVIYGVALLSFCMLLGIVLGEFLGRLFGIDANIGGIGIAMLLLIFLSDYLKNAFKLGDITEKGITFWSMIYIPIVVAMASKQNVLGALDGGLIALLSGGIAVLLSFLLIPVLSKIKK
jgi:malonate transporter MadL subunit|tara:strand:+ start:374 stop:727 length:354 start_codon:yes stop_codon:yes gene_type:complete